MNKINKKMRRQKLAGVFLLLVSAFVIFLAATGVKGDNDCTVILFTIPLSLYLIFSKKQIII